jgi:hypothetical protein
MAIYIRGFDWLLTSCRTERGPLSMVLWQEKKSQKVTEDKTFNTFL